jgi:signal transduction histidine kinase/GAF domain-containing protein
MSPLPRSIQPQLHKLVALQKTLARAASSTDPAFTADQGQPVLFSILIQEICKLLDCQVAALILVDEANENWVIRRTFSTQTQAQEKTEAEPSAIGATHLISSNEVTGSQSKPKFAASDRASLRSDVGAFPRQSALAGQGLDQQGLIQECLRSQKSISLSLPSTDNDASSEARYDPTSDGLEGVQVQSMLCTPLIANAQSIGVIQAVNKLGGKPETTPTFTGEDKALLEMIAGLASSILDNLQLNQQLKLSCADLEASHWELASAQNTVNALFDNLPDAIYIIDNNYRIAAINRSRAQHTAVFSTATASPQSLVGQTCYQALFNLAEPCPLCQVQETFRTGQSTQRIERRSNNPAVQLRQAATGVPPLVTGSEDAQWLEEALEWEIHTYSISSQVSQPVSLNGEEPPAAFTDAKVFQVVVLEKDITEKRQLENILTQSEKLAAMGQLAAGIAHEINNPLTAIIANAQILRRSLPPDDDMQESVDLIARAGARAVQVVRNLLDFARKEDYHLGLTNLNENLGRAIELVQHELLSRGVQLTFDQDPDLPPILASQDHLQSVWLNLLLNAIDSLDKPDGNITVATQRVKENIIVTVVDNGKGIPIERLGRIFEPFYTTKAPGRGTGLGLSVSHRIVQQHGGTIRVESQVGQGSTFTVILPVNY